MSPRLRDHIARLGVREVLADHRLPHLFKLQLFDKESITVYAFTEPYAMLRLLNHEYQIIFANTFDDQESVIIAVKEIHSKTIPDCSFKWMIR